MSATKQQPKKNNRGLWIACGICVGVVILLIASLLLAPLLSANSRRKDAIRFLEQSGEVKVVLTDPTRSGEALLSTAETTLSGEEAEALKDRLRDFLTHTDYDETYDAPAGLWCTYATVYREEGEFRLYLREDELLLDKNGRITSFEPEDAYEERYEDFYRGIIALLP